MLRSGAMAVVSMASTGAVAGDPVYSRLVQRIGMKRAIANDPVRVTRVGATTSRTSPLYLSTPAEVLHRNFWFSTIDDPSTLSTRDVVGVDHITFESDYPHGDGTWPDTQKVFDEVFGGLGPDEIAKISHENATALFRHPLPPPGNPHAIGVRT